MIGPKGLLLLLVLSVVSVLQAQEVTDIYAGMSVDDQLMTAADRGDTLKVMALLKTGANINATTYEGVTPLMFAAQQGHHRIVNLLLANGAEPDKKTGDGFTALILAILGGHFEAVQGLIRHGANPELPDNNDVTPLMHAVETDSFYMPDLLLYYGASVDQRDNRGSDALMRACKYGRYEIAIKLLEAGADINATDNSGNTPLHYAVSGAQTEVLELLIYNGAFIESKNNTGYTPLALAVALNDFEAARLLIGYGADINSQVNKTLNPLTIALNNRNEQLVAMLRNQNAKAIQKLVMNVWSLGARYSNSADDSRLELTFGLSDKKYNIMAGLNMGFRPKAVPVLEDAEENVYYQYWENRGFVTLSIDKAFFLHHDHHTFAVGPFIGMSETFSFGGFRGSSENPAPRLSFVPRVGLAGQQGHLRLKLSYEYMDLKMKEYNRGWVSLSFEYLWSSGNSKIKRP